MSQFMVKVGVYNSKVWVKFMVPVTAGVVLEIMIRVGNLLDLD